DKVMESKPVEAKPAEKAAEAKPADKVMESKPVEAKPVETRMSPGETVRFSGESYRVAGFVGAQVVLQRPGVVESAIAEPITAADLETKYEAVKLEINGTEQTRYMEKGQPGKGLFQITEAGGQRFIAADATLTVASAPSVERVTSGGTAAGTSPVSKPLEAKPVEVPGAKPVERVAPPRDGAAAPSAERLQGTSIVAQGDGTIRREGSTIGEVSVERLRSQTELSPDQIRAMELEANRLKASELAADKQKGEQLERVVRTLRGEFGAEARTAAHTGVLTEAKREIELRPGRVGVGTGVAVGILAVAAFAWFLNSQNRPTAPLQRPSVTGNNSK
ncbi:MAG: hypothetical protein K2W95_06170, partial [Candidatus Obscuribacterales bacterium]|nr:hypothetical protein [Candidatus Obscuribacterales bacterium]